LSLDFPVSPPRLLRKKKTMNVKQDLLSLMPFKEFTRRDFIVTMLAAGFAAAVRPIAAQTVIQTDSQGLVAGEV
jgi:carboxymethylenebutenolidase